MPAQSPVQTRLLVGGALFLLLTAVGAIVSYRTAAAFFRINQAVRAGAERLLDAREVFVGLIDAETGQRGFLLTGRREFLQPYDSSVARLEARLERLRADYAGDPAGLALADSLAVLARRRVQMLEQGLAIHRSRGFQAGTEFVAAGVGKAQMDSTRALIGSLERLERSRIAQLGTRADLLGERTLLAVGVLAALTLLLAAAIAWLLARYFRDQRLALRRLETSEERFRSFMGHTPTVTFIKDEQGRYLYANRRLLQLFNQEASRIEGRTDAELLPDRIAEHLAANDRRVLQSGRPHELLEVVAPFQGEEREFLTLKFPIRDETATYIGGVAVDVTERRRAEAQVSALNRELEQRVRELTELTSDLDAFAYTVSHDLRAPLRAIQGFADALNEEYGDRLDETGRDYARRLANAGRSMDQLIQDLLAYGRLRRADVPVGPLELEPFLDRILAPVRMRGDLPPTTSMALPALPPVLANATILEQVVLNLLSNAMKFIRPGAAPQVSIGAARHGERVRLWVEDRGIGVPPSQAERIFRPFERLHGSETYPGTGIGLAIVRRGMERMGGAAGVEPVPDGGSRFWLELRVAEIEHEMA